LRSNRHKKGEGGEVEVEFLGVDIYSPLTGEVKSTGATKVAAWFLDSEHDGSCFCIA
jgi:adenine-specific DNA-methyltransferase